MKKYTGLFLCAVCALALLLAGCTPGIVFTSPSDEDFQEEFREDWEDSMEELQKDWDSLQEKYGGFSDEKEHRWRVLDTAGEELSTVTEAETVKLLDDLLSDGGWKAAEKDPGDPAYTYIYSQEETLKAGQDPAGERAYEDLMSFAVSASEDVVTVRVLSALDDLTLPDGLQDLLTFHCAVPAETAEALRNPAQFVGEA